MRWDTAKTIAGKRAAAYYTAEASLVLLISLFAIFSMIFLAFYLHDIQSLQAEMNRLTSRAAAEEWTDEKLTETLSGRLERGEFRLLFLQVDTMEVRKESGRKVLTVEVRFPMPGYARSFFREVVRQGILKSPVEPHEPEEFARKTEAVKQVVE